MLILNKGSLNKNITATNLTLKHTMTLIPRSLLSFKRAEEESKDQAEPFLDLVGEPQKKSQIVIKRLVKKSNLEGSTGY